MVSLRCVVCSRLDAADLPVAMKTATLLSLRVDPALREAVDVVEGLAEQLESGQRSPRAPQWSRRRGLDSPRMQARPARCLRREGGEYNTRKGNKPAGYARF